MSEKKRSKFIRFLSYAILLLLMLYVLSIGPVFAVFVAGKHDKEAYDFFITFYAPIVWADQNTPLKNVIGPYMIFWERVFH